MPIVQYVPPKKKIVDHRKPDGGFYIAKCEVCGGEFYPQRSNAKYCTPNCGLIAHRIAVANGTAQKREVAKASNGGAMETWSGVSLIGRETVVGYLRKHNLPVYGLKKALMELKMGETTTWEGVKIRRVNTSRYEVKLGNK